MSDVYEKYLSMTKGTGVAISFCARRAQGTMLLSIRVCP